MSDLKNLGMLVTAMTAAKLVETKISSPKAVSPVAEKKKGFWAEVKEGWDEERAKKDENPLSFLSELLQPKKSPIEEVLGSLAKMGNDGKNPLAEIMKGLSKPKNPLEQLIEGLTGKKSQSPLEQILQNFNGGWNAEVRSKERAIQEMERQIREEKASVNFKNEMKKEMAEEAKKIFGFSKEKIEEVQREARKVERELNKQVASLEDEVIALDAILAANNITR